MALLEFFGAECPHCIKMAELVKKIEKEEQIKIEQLEVWHNQENAAKVNEYDKGLCGGVPFFFNTDSGKFLCGEASYEDLVAWAKGDGGNEG